jgi:hypothetical protein
VTTDILIVARNQPQLYVYLKDDFANDADVRIIIDRRRGERRRAVTGTSDDRRQSDRRVRADVASKLESVGFAVVRVGGADGPPQAARS